MPDVTLSLSTWFRDILVVTLFNLTVAVFASLILPYSFLESVIFSQSVGLSVFVGAKLFLPKGGNQLLNLLQLSSVILICAVIGVTLASILDGYNLATLYEESPEIVFSEFATAFFLGIIIAYFVYARSLLAQKEAALLEENLRREEHQKSLTQTQLKLLQAQIEPHFLFNTLSNVISLIDHDPTRAQHMLEQLTDYLRASLHRTRDTKTTLSEELALLRAYLSIQQMRMGERLKYRLDADAGLLSLPFPPMLIQPLVENAIQHGLSPLIEGGTITVTIKSDAQVLNISVSDTGRGVLNLTDTAGHGVGLKNIHKRLFALYGEEASLSLESNEPIGTNAIICIPLEAARQPSPEET